MAHQSMENIERRTSNAECQAAATPLARIHGRHSSFDFRSFATPFNRFRGAALGGMAACLAAALMLSGCLSAPRAWVIGSSTSGHLLHETTRAVLLADSIRSRGCRQWPHITVEPVLSDKPGVIVERWCVERCGERRYYRISYTPTRAIRGANVLVSEDNVREQPAARPPPIDAVRRELPASAPATNPPSQLPPVTNVPPQWAPVPVPPQGTAPATNPPPQWPPATNRFGPQW